jgi:hypothetical protein
MKTNRIVLSLVVLATVLVGCGRKAQKEDQISTRALNLRNFGSNSFRDYSVSFQGEKYQILGLFERSDLPADVQKLTNGSKIGELSVLKAEFKYAPEYQGVADAEVNHVTEDTKNAVYLIEWNDKIALTIKIPAEGLILSNKEESVQVRSEFKNYCSEVHVQSFSTKKESGTESFQLVDKRALCNIQGVCQVAVNVQICFGGCRSSTQMMPLPIGGNGDFELITICDKEASGPTKNETKTNKTFLLEAKVKLSKSLSKEWGVLQFGL